MPRILLLALLSLAGCMSTRGGGGGLTRYDPQTKYRILINGDDGFRLMIVFVSHPGSYGTDEAIRYSKIVFKKVASDLAASNSLEIEMIEDHRITATTDMNALDRRLTCYLTGDVSYKKE